MELALWATQLATGMFGAEETPSDIVFQTLSAVFIFAIFLIFLDRIYFKKTSFREGLQDGNVAVGLTVAAILISAAILASSVVGSR